MKGSTNKLKEAFSSHFFYWAKLLALIFIFKGCSLFKSSLDNSKTHTITLKQNATVLDGDGQQLSLAKGDIIHLKNSPLLIESPGYVGLLIVPSMPFAAKTEIKLKEISDETISRKIRRENSLKMNKVLMKITEIQKAIAENKIELSLDMTKSLRQEFPDITYLKFIEASCHILLNNRDTAKTLMEDALTDFPDDKNATDMYISLLNENERSDKMAHLNELRNLRINGERDRDSILDKKKVDKSLP